MKVAVVVLAVQACSFFRNGRGARGGRRACISGGGGETLAGKTGSEASSLQTRFFQRLCGRRKQKQVFTIRAASREPYERRGGANGLDGTGLQAATGREGEAMGGVA